jgi:HSP20 family protein
MLVRYKTVPSFLNEIDGFFNPARPIVNRYSFVNSTHGVVVKESGDLITVIVELPGIAKEDIKVTMHDTVLTVTAERKKIELKDNEQWIRNEIRYGNIERSVNLPYKVVVEKITASQENGLLHIVLPKAEDAKPKQITIK